MIWEGQKLSASSGDRRFHHPRPTSAASLFFRIHTLRLFDRKVDGHLIDPGRHTVSQRPFDREIRGMTRLARSEFGRLLFGALLGGGKLRLECFDMRFERLDDPIG